LTDNLLNEIKKKKKEVAPNSKNQKAQAELIENFIQKKPRAVSPPKHGANAGITPADEVLSSVLRMDVASETLANILAEQGKIDMAVEMLKKLIWKYPHKKPYFAGKIHLLTGKQP